MGVGMVDKVEIEILAVGQGSCNVVKGIDTTQSNKLEYLAILDAGSEHLGDPDAIETGNQLISYMRQRALAMGTDATTDYYADLLLISHSDKDHYSIIHGITYNKPPHTAVTSRGRKKVKPAIKNRSILRNETDEDEYETSNNYAFEIYESKVLIDNYAYIYHTDTQLGPFFYEKSIYANLETIPRYICEIFIINRTYTLTFSVFSTPQAGTEFCFSHGSVDITAELKQSGEDIEVKIGADIYTLKNAKMPTDIAQLSLLLNSRGFEKVDSEFASFFLMLSQMHNNIDTFAVLPSYQVNLSTIYKELGYSAYGGMDMAVVNSVEFGEVITSVAKDEPPNVAFLVAKKKDIPPLRPTSLFLEFLHKPAGKCEFYKSKYKEDGGTNNTDFDKYFRNINSIITIVGLQGIGSKFIFPGDATVQNLWYNAKHNGGILKGSGNNYFVLPHHGAYRTTYGKVCSSPSQGSHSVLKQFLNCVEPGHIYVSAGYQSSFGHPNVWTLNKCASFFEDHDLKSVDEHAVYYNKTNEKPTKSERLSHFLYCKYDKPLYTTITLDSASTQSPMAISVNYCITFQGQSVVHSILRQGGLRQSVTADKIKSFSGGKFPVTIQEAPVMREHPVFDFLED